ncbi:condensation domain-containing protein [Micromonospora sp. NPDC047134]|uniref:condensation domain-containing protein n=1 Tax=Micromonospora sp. NPDC047134 TaxID=3154340 RepID=UPI0033F92FAA
MNRPAGTPEDRAGLRALVRDEVAALTGGSPPGDEEDLFALGLDSLDLVRLVSRLYEVTGANLRVADVLDRRRVAALAEVLVDRLPAAGAGDTPALRETTALGEGQVRLWLDDNIRPEHALGNVLRVAFRLVGEVDPAALEDALRTVVARHGALRTAIDADPDGLPVARPLSVPQALLVRRSTTTAPGTDVDQAQRLADELTSEVHLDRGPLVAAGITRTAHEVLLVLAVHHAAFDGDSVAILAREVSGLLSGRPLTDQPLPYAAFAAAQQEAPRADLTARTREWAERFRDLPALAWPDAPGRAEAAALGEEPVTIAAEHADRFERQARQLGVSPFVLGLSAFARTVAATTATTSLAVCVPHSARDDRRFDDTIGFFVATLPIPVVLPDPGDDLLVSQLDGTVAEAMRNGDVTLPAILRRLRRRRSSLFQVQFAWSNWPEPSWTVPGVTVEELPLRPLATQYDLTLEVFPRRPGEPLRGVVEFDPTVVAPAVAAELGVGFAERFARVAATPAA